LPLGFGFFGALLALIYLYLVPSPPGIWRSLAKTGSVLVLAVAVWWGGGASWAVVGLLAASLGDLALSRAGERAFQAGVAAFAVAQICFVLGFDVDVGSVLGLGGGLPSPLIALLTAGALVALGLGSGGTLTRGLVAIYVPLLLGIGLMALASGNLWWIAGAALFIISDALIAVSLFERVPALAKQRLAYLVWASYWPAVTCLSVGFLVT
jgi:uncharacterized membrane protein YhhN